MKLTLPLINSQSLIRQVLQRDHIRGTMLLITLSSLWLAATINSNPSSYPLIKYEETCKRIREMGKQMRKVSR